MSNRIEILTTKASRLETELCRREAELCRATGKESPADVRAAKAATALATYRAAKKKALHAYYDALRDIEIGAPGEDRR